MILFMYQGKKSCADLMMSISVVIQKRIIIRVRNSAFFGVMIDESTDINVAGHLVVFASIVEEGLLVTLFLGLLQIREGKKDLAIIYETLISSIRKWRLDLQKFVGFGSDGASTMVGSLTGVAAQIKEQVNLYLLACHCVAHQTNLAALDAAKSLDCTIISSQVDSLLNSIVGFFNKSSKRKHVLTRLQEEFFDVKKTMKRYHKIRWLSWWQAITTLCKSLESILEFFRDLKGKDASTATPILQKLGQFKFVCILYFLADILHCLAMLSKMFQCKFVDVTVVGSIVRSKIAKIRMLFIVKTTDLNADMFNEDSSYHVLPEYNSLENLLMKLPFEIRGNMYHGCKIQHSRLGTDLEEALQFQRLFAEAICASLEARFCDNDLISCFKILNPSNMPSKQVGLQSWGVTELDNLLQPYRTHWSHSGFSFLPF